MGTLFALALGTTNLMTARPEAVAAGMSVTFAVAALLIAFALGIASITLSRHSVSPDR